MMIGKRLSPILEEIEQTLFEFEANYETKPDYTPEGFRAVTKIFMSALMDKIWELQVNEKMPMKERLDMVYKAGCELRQLIKTYTNIDTHKIYEPS